MMQQTISSQERGKRWFEALPPPGQMAALPGIWVPRVDIVEEGDTLVIRADLSGVTAGDFEVALDRQDLVISGQRMNREEGSLEVARTRGRFYRRVTLPFPIEWEEIGAQFLDGILTVTAPKPADATARR